MRGSTHAPLDPHQRKGNLENVTMRYLVKTLLGGAEQNRQRDNEQSLQNIPAGNSRRGKILGDPGRESSFSHQKCSFRPQVAPPTESLALRILHAGGGLLSGLGGKEHRLLPRPLLVASLAYCRTSLWGCR